MLYTDLLELELSSRARATAVRELYTILSI